MGIQPKGSKQPFPIAKNKNTAHTKSSTQRVRGGDIDIGVAMIPKSTLIYSMALIPKCWLIRMSSRN